VLVFGDQSQWISPLAPAADKQALLKAIDTLKAEGTTNMAPAMERARLALSQAAADRKHVILLSDGVSTPGDFDRIARAMAAAGITVSTVSVSQGADQTILRDIAQVAGGRHYHCDDPREVPHILETETRNTAARGAAAEIRPMIYKRMDGLEVGKAPALLGYVATNPKPDAELWLLTPGGDPLLAGITHGTGRVVAMAADIAGPAAVHWQRWDGYGPFLARLARHVLKPRGPEFRITTERRFGQLTITLHKAATVGRGPVRNVSLISKFVGDDGKGTVPATQSMVEEVDGKYVTMVDTTATGIYNLTIRANDSDGQPIEQRLAIAVDYPDELQFGPADDKLLTAVASATGGRVLTDPAQGVPPDGRAVERVIRLWPPLVMAAMLLLVVEVALRRLVGPPCRGGPHVSGKESERVSAACH
jgi:hypothetical protein